MAYSLDFRRQVFKLKQKEGLTYQQTSERFGITIRTLFRWANGIEPKTSRDKPSTKIDMEALKGDIIDHPDRYQYERAEVFGVSQSAIFYALKRLGITNKKTLFHPKTDLLLRLKFIFKIFRYQYIEKRPVVYVDESGFSVDHPRDRGYSLKGQRCYGVKNWHCRGRVNAIGAIIGFRLLTVCLFETNINADIFKLWLTHDLLPKLPEKAVIVLDNATFHKRKDIIEMVQKHGHTLEFLPPYSPDLNPIENKWAQAKAIRRNLGAIRINFFYIQNYGLLY